MPAAKQRTARTETTQTRTTARSQSAAGLERSLPAAPPVYRPQVSQKCLQPKQAVPSPASHSPASVRARVPQPTRTMSSHAAARSNVIAKQPHIQQRHESQTRVLQPMTRKSIAPKTPTTSQVVQATKLYPNLHPGAVEPVEAGNVFRLNSFANQYRLHKVNSHSVNVPNQQYNFVRTREGEMLLHARYRHPSIAEGKQVLYAGEIFFNNGRLEWWSNGSGHYQPYAEDAEQANLPMDQFFSYQQIIKGEHKRKKG